MDDSDGILAKAKDQIAKRRTEATADQAPAEHRATEDPGTYINYKRGFW